METTTSCYNGWDSSPEFARGAKQLKFTEFPQSQIQFRMESATPLPPQAESERSFLERIIVGAITLGEVNVRRDAESPASVVARLHSFLS